MAIFPRAQRPRVVDVVLVAVLLFFGLGGTRPAYENQHDMALEPGGWAMLLVAVAVLPLLFWRRFPLPVLAVNSGAIALFLAIGYPFGPILFSGVVTIGLFALSQSLRRVLMFVGAVLAVAIVSVVVRAVRLDLDWFTGTVTTFWSALWIVLPAAVGVAVHIRRDARARVREEQARRAVSEEQLRMAQELHDVVGHGLAVIAMQAGVGLHVLERNPGKAREALEAIRGTSKEALDSLRAEIAALRAPHDGGDDADPQRRPTPGLADLETLVQRVRSGGLEVTVRMDAVMDGVPDEVDQAAYRIVQESLTNVLRHAGPAAAAKVLVRRRGDSLLVDVEDTGEGPSDAQVVEGRVVEGTGIRGMRSRAAALGGTVEAGAGETAGFAVRARLPLRPPTGARQATEA